MNNAFWLILALPEWYFATLLAPLSASYLSLVPAVGVVSFVVGTGIGIYRRNRGLWLFLIPFVLCEALVAFAGFNRGEIREAVSTPILLSFLALVVAISVWMIWRFKNARLPAVLLSVFTVTYALFATFIASMAFSDSWL
jgi:hypothetical protein